MTTLTANLVDGSVDLVLAVLIVALAALLLALILTFTVTKTIPGHPAPPADIVLVWAPPVGHGGTV